MFELSSIEIVYYDVSLNQLLIVESDAASITMVVIGMFGSDTHHYVGTLDA